MSQKLKKPKLVDEFFQGETKFKVYTHLDSDNDPTPTLEIVNGSAHIKITMSGTLYRLGKFLCESAVKSDLMHDLDKTHTKESITAFYEAKYKENK